MFLFRQKKGHSHYKLVITPVKTGRIVLLYDILAYMGVISACCANFLQGSRDCKEIIHDRQYSLQ